MNTLMIMEMLKENNCKIDTEIYLKKLKEWTENSPIAGYVTGPSTSIALKEIENGKSFEESGKFGTTNGASMKIPPIGLASDYRNQKQLIENVVNICKPTHNTSIALSGALVIAAIVSYFYNGGSSFDKMYEIAYKVSDNSKSYGFKWPSASLSFKISQARKIVETAQEGVSEEIILDRLYAEIGCSMESIDTVPTAIAIFTLSGGDALKCARLAARVGGDTDTIGAIAVGICGVYKPETIPFEMIKKIQEVNGIDFEKYI